MNEKWHKIVSSSKSSFNILTHQQSKGVQWIYKKYEFPQIFTIIVNK